VLLAFFLIFSFLSPKNLLLEQFQMNGIVWYFISWIKATASRYRAKCRTHISPIFSLPTTGGLQDIPAYDAGKGSQHEAKISVA